MKKREALIALVSIAISGILNEPIIAAFRMIPWDKIISTENWEWVFLPKVSILNIIFFIILLVTVYYIAYLLLIKRKNVAINKLKSLNCFVDDEKHIKVTWDVGIGTYDHNPFAYNIQFFCLQHGELPLRMQNGCCLDSTCSNQLHYSLEFRIFNAKVLLSYVNNCHTFIIYFHKYTNCTFSSLFSKKIVVFTSTSTFCEKMRVIYL